MFNLDKTTVLSKNCNDAIDTLKSKVKASADAIVEANWVAKQEKVQV